MVSSFEFVQVLKVTFNNQPFALGQKFQVKFDSIVYFCTVMSMANYNELIQENGLITSVSAIELTSKSNDLTFVGIANSSFSSKQVRFSFLFFSFVLKKLTTLGTSFANQRYSSPRVRSRWP